MKDDAPANRKTLSWLWYEFAKLPDRVLMVDPKDRSIAEIILIPTTPATTGAAPSGPSGR
jgi:hypothetical protein